MSVIAAPSRSRASTPVPLRSPTTADADADADAARASAERSSREAKGARVALSSRVYLPAVSIAAVAAVLVGIGWSNRWGGANFVGAMTSLRVVVVGPLTLAIIGLFLIVERLRPAQRRPIFARGYRQDLLYTVLNATLVVPLVAALALSFSEVVHRSLPWLVLARINTLPRWGAIAIIFVAMDGLNWYAHLGNHRVRVLWRFHELHHSQEDMSVLTVFRTHPLIHVSYLIALIPGIVLLANGALPTTLLVIYGVIVAFAHSNTNLGFGPLERMFVSPNYHRIHHKLDGPQDVNLGFTLTIWDQLFHRAVFPTPETIRTDTGLPGRPLIVEQAAERPRHISVFAAQLVAPFRPMRDRTNPASIRDRSTRDGPIGDRSIQDPSIREETRRSGGGSDRSFDYETPADLAAPGTGEESVVA
jgi:sterol desaturase/sphingolipid hydroxylase (fatty acid hydroxylase superfamily)